MTVWDNCSWLKTHMVCYLLWMIRSFYSHKPCYANYDNGDSNSLKTAVAEYLNQMYKDKMTCKWVLNLCFWILSLFSSFLQLTILIGLCLTLYHRVGPMLPLHRVRNNTCAYLHFSHHFFCPNIFLVGRYRLIIELYWETRAILRYCFSICGVEVVNIYNYCSGAYNNAGLVSVGGVITASGPPPSYNSTHKVAGMILDRAFACG